MRLSEIGLRRRSTGACLALAMLGTLRPLPAQKDDWSKTRSFAATQHEIVILLVRKKEYAKAAEEANKIFQMSWPAEQEAVMLKELLNFSNMFFHDDQTPLAVKLLETNFSVFKAPASQASILKEKGFLLTKMGKDDEALNCFQEAQRLEKQEAQHQEKQTVKKKSLF